jgi:hypothetical protein
MRGFRNTSSAQPGSDIHVRGPIDTAIISYTQTVVGRAPHHEPPVRHLKTKSPSTVTTASRRCVAQVNLDIDGRLIRRRSTAPTILLAIGRITAVLPAVLAELSQQLERHPGPTQRRLPLRMALATSGREAPGSHAARAIIASRRCRP